MPESLELIYHVREPLRTLQLIGMLAPSGLGWPSLLQRNPKELARILLGSLADAVDQEAPAIAGVQSGNHADGTPMRAVVSLGLRPLDQVTEAGKGDFEVRPSTDGSWTVRPVDGGEGFGLLSKLGECRIWTTAAVPSYRLVCGSSPKFLSENGEYMARQAPQRELAGTVGVWLSHATLIRSMEEGDHHAEPVNRCRARGRAFAAKTWSDFRSVTLSLDLTQASVVASVGFELTSATTLMSALLQAKPGAPEPLPPVFFRLPQETDVAIYFQGAEGDALHSKAEELWHDMLEEEDEQKYSEAQVREIIATMRETVFTGGSLLVAHGSGTPDLVWAVGLAYKYIDLSAGRRPWLESQSPTMCSSELAPEWSRLWVMVAAAGMIEVVFSMGGSGR